MGSPRTLWRLAREPAVVKTSLTVALLAGTLLNIINQGSQWLRGQGVDLARIVLTYVVPYAVSTIGALSARRRDEAVTPVARADGARPGQRQPGP